MFGKGFLQDVRIQMSQNKKLKEVLDQVRIYIYTYVNIYEYLSYHLNITDFYINSRYTNNINIG